MVTTGLPQISIYEEGMREGMQIERLSITTADKIRLLDTLSRTGLRHIVVGSFVSPKWAPQMADVEEVIRGMTVVPGVEYRALALNPKGVERRAGFSPPLTVDRKPATMVHACDVFGQRNTNRTQHQEIEGWDLTVRKAADSGATTASVGVNAGFGSNWVGDIPTSVTADLLGRQVDLWESRGVAVDRVWLGDPMGWNTPTRVEEVLHVVLDTWPGIKTFHLHLHDQRGAAMVSAFAAMRTLPADAELAVDTSIGGMGGCPYCGNGRATGMIPTEDLVDLVEEMGVATGIDRDRLIDAVLLAEELVGRMLFGKLARAGARPRGEQLYPMDMPFVETLEEASHFRCGPGVYAGQRRPWTGEITSWQRDAALEGAQL